MKAPSWLPRLTVSSAELDGLRRKWGDAGRQAYANAIKTGEEVLARTQSEIEALGRAHLEQEKLRRNQEAAVREGAARVVKGTVQQARRTVIGAGQAIAEGDRLRQAQDRVVMSSAAGAARTPVRLMRRGTESDPGPGRLTAEWATGTGPERRDLGPESSLSREFVQAPTVQRYVQGYVDDWRKRDGGLNGEYTNPRDKRAKFGLTEFVEDLAAGNGASHFVGSWGVGAKRNGDQIDWAAENDTDTTSFFYGRPLREAGLPYVRSYPRPAPGGRTHQTIRFSTDLQGRPLPQR